MKKQAVALTAVAALLLAGCSTNPYTGQSELAFLGEDQISSMAATAWTDLKSQTPQTSNTRMKNRVLNIWSRVERVTPKAGEQWDVAVFDSDDVCPHGRGDGPPLSTPDT